ncbi:MAG: hypothetical protein WC753_01180 [Candidatus Gracilibacteria bacterium]|jgi:hypothetical protein
MNKFTVLSLVAASIFLVSCGKPNLDDVIITPETPIENNAQSAKVCQPVIKYLTCSLASAAEASKKGYENAIKNLQREIDNDDPAKVAQKCDSMVRVLVEKVAQLPKNGCIVEPIYDINAMKPTPAPTTVTPTTERSKK